MIIETLSTFPHMYDSVMGSSMMKIAQEKGIIEFRAYDLREWTHDRHRTTDDEPYGGGHGLIMKCEPIYEAFDDICAGIASRTGSCAEAPREDVTDEEGQLPSLTVASQEEKPVVIFLAPTGMPFNERLACELAEKRRLLFVCGHYEGIDERAYGLADYQISLGDYVLTSGELASMVVIDAVVRKLDGVLGAAQGAQDESFAADLLEYPQYTRPAIYRGMEVPAVLLSGDHGKVAQWRREQSLMRTLALRPDLLDRAQLTDADKRFLKSLTDA